MTRQTGVSAKRSTGKPIENLSKNQRSLDASDMVDGTDDEDDADTVKLIEDEEEEDGAPVHKKKKQLPVVDDITAAEFKGPSEIVPSGEWKPKKKVMKIERAPSTVAADTSGSKVAWKKKKLHVVRPDFDVLYAEVLIKLNNANYLIYGADSEDNPIIRIQDCSYRRTDCRGDVKYVPRCVKLTSRQWMELLDIGDDIVEALKEDEDKRAHIGGNTFVTVKSDRAVIDIRDYFLPPDDNRDLEVSPYDFFDDLVPTKRGVQISVSGWQMLIGKAAEILKEFAGTTIDYSLGTCEHAGQSEYMACLHCNPNGYHLWNTRR